MEGLNKLIACFKEVGLKKLRVEGSSAFENRIVMQKTAYILKEMGVNLDFDFGLYIRGPYSPSLTQEVFAHKKEVETLETDEHLSNSDVQIVDKFKKTELNSAQLEIVATYHFFREQLKLGEDDAVRKLKEMKPFFSETDIFVGISKAKQLFFVPSQHQFKEIQQETRFLDQASNEALKKAG